MVKVNKAKSLGVNSKSGNPQSAWQQYSNSNDWTPTVDAPTKNFGEGMYFNMDGSVGNTGMNVKQPESLVNNYGNTLVNGNQGRPTLTTPSSFNMYSDKGSNGLFDLGVFGASDPTLSAHGKFADSMGMLDKPEQFSSFMAENPGEITKWQATQDADARLGAIGAYQDSLETNSMMSGFGAAADGLGALTTLGSYFDQKDLNKTKKKALEQNIMTAFQNRQDRTNFLSNASSAFAPKTA